MAIFYGSDRSQTINGTSYGDTIYGYGGNDTLRGGFGNDLIYGGAGNDNIFGGQGFNTLYGGTGKDWFVMSGRTSWMSDDYIADFRFGQDKIDLRAWGVSDFSQVQALLERNLDGDATLNAVLRGYDHVITIAGKSPAAFISSDFVYASAAGPKTLNGSALDDVLFGSRSHDMLKGFGGDDVLLGGFGNDDLFGGAGNDRLVGGQGWDWLTGGNGEDVFEYRALGDSTPNANRDRITDFELDIDRIDLSAIDAISFIRGNQAFAFVGTAAFTGAGQVRFEFLGGDTLISVNTDNDAYAEMQIMLTGKKFLISGDFIL
ncbi:MAG: M10 family metallopeptidase C-terminal domain-containing protein [Rhizobiaceae bacterium]|nr:M10 family metallopeptidase C-terminal domain-containing protein [Rhizobiaceae bacterium]